MADNESASPFIAPALRAAGRGADLTRHLLAFSRQQPLSPRRLDVDALIDGMTELLRRTLGERVVFETALAAGAHRALADPTQTENAILNLALNARDSMTAGGTLRIETAEATLAAADAGGYEDIAPGRYVMIGVSDEGCGIEPGLIDRVFDPFVTTKGVGEGSGLGLSMVYGFVKQSGGHVRISSEPGKGTTVQLYLPEAEGRTGTDTDPPVREHAPVGNGETVLVVEDDPDVLNLAKVLLTNLNYRVLSAADAEAALGLLNGGATMDLLFTDVVLPGGITGVELAKRIADRWPGIPTIFMSGYSEDALIRDGVKDDGVLLLDKPFRKADLAKLLHLALSDGRAGVTS